MLHSEDEEKKQERGTGGHEVYKGGGKLYL